MPIKSLLRLKCVSKSWHSRISNPNFAKLHLQLSNYSQHPNRILLTSCPHHLSSIDINTSLHDDSDTINLNFPPFKPHDKVRIFCSCRGFVLLFVKQDLFIWNPVTGSDKQISLPPRCKSPPTPFAFCYDESIDDYFIGLSYPFYDLHIQPKWRFAILSLRTNSWEKLDLNRSPFPSLGTIFNGAIHFIVHTRGLPEVIAFDMTTKDLRKVPSPIGRNLCCAELGVHEGGCLALTAETTEEIQVWMMREYGVVESSWTKFISVASDHQSGICSFFIPSLVIYKERDDEFVTTYVGIDFSGEGLAKLNYKGQVVEHIRTYRPDHLCKRPASQFSTPSNIPRTYWRRPIAYTETLLPLPS
ncbi:hypothetical protein K1719_030180 [Acacia pycnantha]|nr:hypothetical protein K1719_030180 [Acacia pycnantha]